MKKFFHAINHYLEYICFVLLTSLLSLVSIDRSASICAALAKKIGPLTSVTKTARGNLRRVYKDLDIATEDKIIEGLWDNFGRFIGEFPHIDSLTMKEINKRVQIEGLENIKVLQDQSKPFLLFTGHFANWDFILRIAEILYPKFGIVYRKANNPFVDKLICKWRSRPNINLIAKGPTGARDLIRSIKAGHSIAMLVDQKMNDGIDVPFFGVNAKTAPAIAKFALQFDYPIIPMQIIRTGGSYFKIILSPALKIDGSDELTIMTNLNEILEEWIRQNPSQWFWFHNRWGKS